MKALLAALLALVSPARAAIDSDAMLDALAQVETGNKWGGKPGTFGELGRCQFRETTWREYANVRFEDFANRDCAISRKVERAHLSRICRQLRERGLPVAPVYIAAAWRFGIGLAERCSYADSARRAANLYWDTMRRRQEAATK